MAAADTNRKRTCAANFTSINILWNSVCSTRRRQATRCDALRHYAANYGRPLAAHQYRNLLTRQPSPPQSVLCSLPRLSCWLSALADCLPGCLTAWLPVDIRLDEYLNCLYCWWISTGPRRLPARSWYGWKCCRVWRLLFLLLLLKRWLCAPC